MKQANLKLFLKNLTTSPGVYRMFNGNGDIIYVGKAKNLKRRVSSYFNRMHADIKTQKMVAQVDRIEITVTTTEKEALLLESNLIKKHRPRYNVFFRDDKSYPYILISAEDFPRITPHRGNHGKRGDYFGPYPSAYAVKETLNCLQKIFPFRTCTTSFFKNRKRPCLQYQIKRCPAPCVGIISQADYANDMDSIKQFLNGKSQPVLQQIARRMDWASDQQQYEEAARLRDQLVALQQLQEQQYINTAKSISVDVMAISSDQGCYAIEVMLVRDGRILGSRHYYPNAGRFEDNSEILEAFVAQYYTVGLGAQDMPQAVIINQDFALDALLSSVFEQQKHKPMWITRPRGQRLKWLQLAQRNAQEALAMRLVEKYSAEARLDALKAALQLKALPQRLECFDISHSHGEATVASCVVFNQQGPARQQYRRFNIQNVQSGDDYAAMRQALLRRYQRLQKEGQTLPDIVFIDGGKGQLKQAVDVFHELKIEGVLLVAISKGETRKPGLEQLWLPGQTLPRILDSIDPALHLIQQIRDESHRFAITGHRGQRDKKRHASPLEGIPGIGPQKRHALIRHFGGWRGVKEASIEELMKVPGISQRIAETIRDMMLQ